MQDLNRSSITGSETHSDIHNNTRSIQRGSLLIRANIAERTASFSSFQPQFEKYDPLKSTVESKWE